MPRLVDHWSAFNRLKNGKMNRIDHMWSAGKAVEIGLQCWGNWKTTLSVKLAATHYKCSVITLEKNGQSSSTTKLRYFKKNLLGEVSGVKNLFPLWIFSYQKLSALLTGVCCSPTTAA